MPVTSIPPNSTPLPNGLIDRLMPTLKDTEFRLLVVVARATLGWHDPRAGNRKEWDWLTHRQLKARTGRSSEAISHALDTLVGQGLLEVRSETGQWLSTPEERRRNLSKLLFRLGPAALLGRDPFPFRPEGEVAHGPVSGDWSERTIGPSFSESENSGLKSEITKAKTTKENRDKKTPYGVWHTDRRVVDNPVNNQAGVTPPLRKKAAVSQPNPNVRRFLEAYRQRFAERSAKGEPPPISWGRDGKLMKGLLAQYEYERLIELLERFFESEDAWVRKRGFALSCFSTVLPHLLMQETGNRSTHEKSPQAIVPVIVPSPPGASWQRAVETGSGISLFERYPDLEKRIQGNA